MSRAVLKTSWAHAILAVSLGIWVASSLPVSAQEGEAPKGKGKGKGPSRPVEPVPRWPDGHVNLGSSPDKKGYWELRPGGQQNRMPRPDAVPFQPWARALFDFRQGATEMYPPLVKCKPGGGPAFFNSPGFEIMEIPELKEVVILNVAGPHSWRIIYMDGRPHPTNLRPTYLGHSTGKWEGDTLVIDSVGFNEKQWMQGSYPTTDKLHLTERITRSSLASLTYEFTIDDPGAYTAPWGGSWSVSESTAASWIADGELFEYICQDGR